MFRFVWLLCNFYHVFTSLFLDGFLRLANNLHSTIALRFSECRFRRRAGDIREYLKYNLNVAYDYTVYMHEMEIGTSRSVPTPKTLTTDHFPTDLPP